MRRSLVGIGCLAVLLSARPAVVRGEPSDKSGRDALALAKRIDGRIAEGWKAKNVTPAPRCDDATFLRRAYLDLTGRIPDLVTARDFIDNPDPDKRRKLVEKLLGSERYAVHFANVWRARLVPQANDPQRGFGYGIDVWLHKQFQDNVPYDRMVRTLLTGGTRGGLDVYVNAFYQANEFKRENLAGATARLFLGVKLECAQCHDHPFASWKRKQFWEFAALFPAGRLPGQPPIPGTDLVKIPGTNKAVKARFLDGKALTPKPGVSSQAALADWMTARDNPYFARAAVNHLWEYLFGVGLIEPIDEPSDTNPPSHPELLDDLARQFAAHDFDFKFLIRAVTASRAYQLSSKPTHPGQNDPRLFARRLVRGLSAEQVFDSLAVATGQPDQQLNYQQQMLMLTRGPARIDFLSRFPTQDRRTEAQTSILQALYLMNGKIVTEATDPRHNSNLAIISEAGTVRMARRIDQLFLIALSRKPRPPERERFVRYAEKGGPSGDTEKALADVFWVLLNSGEFSVNH